MLATATESQAMPTTVKLLFIAVGIGLFIPVIYNVLKATTFQPRPRRRRHDQPKITEARLRHMWVVDRERTNDDAGVTVYVRNKEHK